MALRQILETLPTGFSVVDVVDHDPNREYAIVGIREGSTFWGGVEGGDYVPSGGKAYFTERLDSLYAWVTAQGFVINSHSSVKPKISKFSEQLNEKIRLPLEARVAPAHWVIGRAEALGSPINSPRVPSFVCVYCREEHPGETYVCSRYNKLLYCTACKKNNRTTGIFPSYDRLYSVCTECGTKCGNVLCDVIIPQGEGRYCTQHAQHASCVGCRALLEWTNPNDEPQECNLNVPQPVIPRGFGERPNRFNAALNAFNLVPGPHYVCPDCTQYVCPECTWVRDALVFSAHFGRDVCHRCEESARMLVNEDPSEEDSDIDLTEMLVIPGRENIRRVGIEIEGGHGTLTNQYLIQALRRANLTEQREISGYHNGWHGFVTVERDSSVDWEAVIGPLNMAVPEEVNKLNASVKIIRDMVRRGELKFDLRCGLHIHVDAEKVSLAQAFNLSHLFTYIEDPFFRIAAAKWAIHRSCHTQNSARSNEKYSRKTDFYRYHGGTGGGHDDHYYALSFQNYFRAMLQHCGCGARDNGIWDECVCGNLPKCTFEFRLFNTTANGKKMLAYLALCQALVAKALSMPEIKKPDELYPGLPFRKTALKNMSEAERVDITEAWVPRLRFILHELPLTDDERSAVVYCMLNSDIGVGLGDAGVRELLVVGNR